MHHSWEQISTIKNVGGEKLVKMLEVAIAATCKMEEKTRIECGL